MSILKVFINKLPWKNKAFEYISSNLLIIFKYFSLVGGDDLWAGKKSVSLSFCNSNCKGE